MTRYSMTLVETNTSISISESTGDDAWSDATDAKWFVHNRTPMPNIFLDDWPEERCAL